MRFEGKDARAEFKAAFGVEQPTLQQLWFLTKFAKHIRMRCRNNAAFNNYMNRLFSPAQFREVPKEYNGKQYMGLQIVAASGEKSEEEGSEE